MRNSKCVFLSVLLFAAILTGCGNSADGQSNLSDFNPTETLTLVTGITGNQGGGVAAELIKNGFKLRGLTRNTESDRANYWRDLGVEMVQGDFIDHASIESALVGMDYLFINRQEQIPNYVDETKFLLDTTNQAGVKYVLYSSNRRSEPERPQSAS